MISLAGRERLDEADRMSRYGQHDAVIIKIYYKLVEINKNEVFLIDSVFEYDQSELASVNRLPERCPV